MPQILTKGRLRVDTGVPLVVSIVPNFFLNKEALSTWEILMVAHMTPCPENLPRATRGPGSLSGTGPNDTV